MRNIVIPVPEDYEVESVTITFKRPPLIVAKQDGSIAAFEQSPQGMACQYCGINLPSKKSRALHERGCISKTPIARERKKKTLEKQFPGEERKKRGKVKRSRFTEEEKAYIRGHAGGPAGEVAAHLGVKKGAIFDFRYREKKAAGVVTKNDLYAKMRAADGKPAVPPMAGSTAPPAPQSKGSPTSTLPPENTEPRPSFFDSIKQKFTGPQVPADFKPSKPFDIGAYIYHAAGRKIGKVITIDQQRDLVTVDFPDQTLQFTVDGAKSMHKEMIARAK